MGEGCKLNPTLDMQLQLELPMDGLVVTRSVIAAN
ncbi:hypothetical protein Goari_018159 [Gossypium aridum]|uniref:Uncharacterized protein n=1 Tax=Gossypium aridum TaxID=34290 RepID=A0A7J8WP63_GOSAI|nr:hypothetical protein [Gossypium aridum]